MSKEDEPVDQDCEILAEKVYTQHNSHSPAEVIVEAVAEAADADPLELAPMHDFIDPDAVNKLFSGTGTSTDGQYLSFRFDEWMVSVHADGIVRVRDVLYPIEI